MSIHRLDAVAHGECHGARTTAAALESFMHLVQKKDRPYFKAILDYIRMNTLRWVQDEGYSSDFMFRNHKRKGHTLVSAEAYISSTPASGVPTNREAVSARDAKQTEPSAPCGSACNFSTSAQIGGNSPLADAPVDKSSNTARGGAPEPRNPSNAAAIRETLDGMMYEAFFLCDSGIPPVIERGKLLARWCDKLRAAMMPNQFTSPTAGRAGSAETAEAKGSTSTGNSED